MMSNQRSRGHLPAALSPMQIRPPRIVTDLVDRPRLWSVLDRGANLPLMLVIAPAGYGKTTSVAAWLERRAADTAWLILDDSHNDLRRFITSVVAAIELATPAATGRLAGLLDVDPLPEVSVLAAAF